MKRESGHITHKVVIGYILLIIISICAVGYVFKIVKQVAAEAEVIHSVPRQKATLVNNTLSLLYESEALGQMLGMPENKLRHFNNTLNRANRNMDSLRTMITDSVQLLKIDTIQMLLKQKRYNTKQLIETWNETNSERLYTQNIEKIIAIPDTTIHRVVRIEERVNVKQDTIVIHPKKLGFFKRLGEVFSPSSKDSTIVVNTTKEIVTDTIVNSYNPGDTIMSVLKSIQDSVAWQRQQLQDLLQKRAANLRYSNSVITSRINQLLRAIEAEEASHAMERMVKKQELLRETSHRISEIAIISVLIAIIFLFIITRDISRSKYYRLKLEKSNKYNEDLLQSREKLILTISHDIRAPLSSIIGYIELLLRRKPDERQQYFLENMRGSSDHILSLVNDLLDYQRLEAGEIEIHPIPIRVSGLFDEIYTSFRPLAETKGLQFDLKVGDAESYEKVYMGDPIRLRQIVGNLLSNAIKFTHEGRVIVFVSVRKEELTVVVSDSGIGIPKAEQERIFSEFTRVAGSENTEGFGLGLSITLKLISLMRGKLSLQSEPGKGSDFTVTLPLPLAENQQLPQEATSGEEMVEKASVNTLPGREIYCLLVDDDPLQLALTEELLKLSQVRVVTCTNPHMVVRLLREQHFDAVITDIQMPGMDGFSLLKSIRNSSLPDAETIPVISLSASVAKEQQHYIEAGFTGFLNKPFTAHRLIELLNNLLTIQLEPKCELNFQSLTAFAGEDKEASDSILRIFHEETTKSIHLLQDALSNGDREMSMKVSHKLIPLFTMLGANTLVQHLRILEKNDAELTDSGWDRILKEVIEQTTTIVNQMGNV